MSISDDIKELGLPGSKHVYEEAEISKDVFYGWANRFPRVIDLLAKGCAYEAAVKTKSDIDEGLVMVVAPAQYKEALKILKEKIE